MPSLIARIIAGFVVYSTTLLLVACGSHHSENDRLTHDENMPVISGDPAGYNTSDVTFADEMKPHEQRALDLVRLAQDRSGNSAVVAFAIRTGASLQFDLQVLTALRVQWKEGQDNPTVASGPSIAPSTTIGDDTIAKLASLRGPEFDTLWLKSMTGLDQGAIAMATAETASGKNLDAVGIAKQIVKERQAEIGEMQQIAGSP